MVPRSSSATRTPFSRSTPGPLRAERISSCVVVTSGMTSCSHSTATCQSSSRSSARFTGRKVVTRDEHRGSAAISHLHFGPAPACGACRGFDGDMTQPTEEPRLVVVDPEGQQVVQGPAGLLVPVTDHEDNEGPTPLTELVEQPAKVMRIGSMIKQLLDEVRSAPLDEASRARLRDIHRRSVTELEDGLAPELREELERLSLPFTDEVVPSDGELRIAQAQLVGWLEGLFHGIQTTLFAQQMAAQSQLQEMRRRALPPGAGEPGEEGPTDRFGSTCDDADDPTREHAGARQPAVLGLHAHGHSDRR